MQQYFLEHDLEIGQVFKLENKDDCFHLKKVMRAKAGTQIEIAAAENIYECEVVMLEPEITCQVKFKKERNAEMPIEITIIQGLPKLDKMDFIIQKGVELGATRFIPWNAKRSIVKYDTKKAEQKRIRWQKIAKEAAEQAHRNKIPEVTSVMMTKEVLQHVVEYDAVLIGSERLAKEEIQKQYLLKQLKDYPTGSKIACIIGPEGGIDDTEFEQFLQKKCLETTFGRRILRTETASLYFLSAVGFLYE